MKEQYIYRLTRNIISTIVKTLNDLHYDLKKIEEDEYNIGKTGIKLIIRFANPVDFFDDNAGDFTKLLRVDSSINDGTIDIFINRQWLKFICFCKIKDEESFKICDGKLKDYIAYMLDKQFKLFGKYISDKLSDIEKFIIQQSIENFKKNHIVYNEYTEDSVIFKIERFDVLSRIKDTIFGMHTDEEYDELCKYMDEVHDAYYALKTYIPGKGNLPLTLNNSIFGIISLINHLNDLYECEVLPEAIAKHPDPECKDILENGVTLRFNVNEALYWQVMRNNNARDINCKSPWLKDFIRKNSPMFRSAAATYPLYDGGKYESYNMREIMISVNIENLVSDIITQSKTGLFDNEEIFHKIYDRWRVIFRHEIGHAIWISKLIMQGRDAYYGWSDFCHKIKHLEYRKMEKIAPKDREPGRWMYYMRDPSERKANEMMDLSFEDIMKGAHPEEPFTKRMKELMNKYTPADIEAEQAKMLAESSM